MENEVARVNKSSAISNRLQRYTPAAIAGNLFVYGFLICLFIITFFPFWHIFVLSLNDASDPTYGRFMLWPNEFSLDSYKTVLKDSEILSSILVTVGRTVIGVPLTLACISMLAYALSKRDLVGWRGINLFFIFTMYFGGGLIPTYMIVRSFNLIDSFWVFIFPGVISVFWMILVRTYMEGLPKEMEEAAQMEGANDIQIFVKVILPVCTPVIATIALFSAISHWNAWYDSYIYTYAASLKTLSAVLVKILNQYQTNDMLNEAQQLANEQRKMPVSSETIRMAVTMVATLPIILLYPLLQKYFLKGMLIGSVKG
ncbi:putative aldouronate transport system permease protein [Paenibacillus sp. UNC496MF]|uniref:carbohydrate ABC transporter permease n=1 Tax=Paenibacillus sp. UNC496MF TaxID=1502753 RepID=UPI0008F0E737|nr:carbohydrate ABC transporter permease [Paenibacillus sp. UNC496MF]SFJ60131.1 putative aldouronate transport system permease protein [Paenibacillus sp. UNC496MF]